MDRSRTVLYSVKSLSNKIKYLLENLSLPLTGMQHAIIYFVSDTSKQPEYFQKDIEMEFNISRSTASGLLKRMEKNGLILRETAESDTRLKKIILTDKALEVNQSAAEEILELEGKILTGITREELTAFFQVIEKVNQNIAKL